MLFSSVRGDHDFGFVASLAADGFAGQACFVDFEFAIHVGGLFLRHRQFHVASDRRIDQQRRFSVRPQDGGHFVHAG